MNTPANNIDVNNLEDILTERSLMDMYKTIIDDERKNMKTQVAYLKDQIEYLKSELTRKSTIIEKLIDNNNKSLECFNIKPDYDIYSDQHYYNNTNYDYYNNTNYDDNNPLQTTSAFLDKQFTIDDRNVTKRKNGTNTGVKIPNDHNNYESTPNYSTSNNSRIESSNRDNCSIKTLPNVAILGDSILNNIEGHGISKHGNVRVSSFSGATSDHLKHHIMPTINSNPPDMIIMHIGSNDLTKGGDTTANIQWIINKVRKCASHTKIVLSSLIMRRDKTNIEKHANELNVKLKQLCDENLIDFIDNSNIDESCLGKKKLHPNKKGKAFLANNFKHYLSTM